MPHFGIFYTPDGLWYRKDNRFYTFYGGSANHARSNGSQCHNINNFSTFLHWLVGASNKYTPDGFWYNKYSQYHPLVGSNARDRLLCGYTSFQIGNNWRLSEWDFGASNKYTPDGLSWRETSDIMYLRISGGVLKTSQTLGASFFDLNVAATWPYWYSGASLQMESGGGIMT